MNLLGIVAVSGKPGLWRALAQNKAGYILESLDEKKTKLVANVSTAKLAALDEITIFGENEDIKLKDVFERMKTAANIPDVKDSHKMREYFREVAPDHDEEKVYASDMKKVLAWFSILKDMPLFNEPDPAAAPPVDAMPVAEPVAVEEPAVVIPPAEAAPEKKKPAAKKPAK